MEKLINITPSALKYLKSSVKDGGHLGVRIDIKPGGCSGMTYELNFVDNVVASDLVMEEDSLPLYISSKAIIFVANMTMDYVKNAMGGSIVFENPNAKMNCSCGRSFCIDENDSACSGCN